MRSISHVLKTTKPICVIFGTFQFLLFSTCLLTSLSSMLHTKWRNLVQDNNSFPLFKPKAAFLSLLLTLLHTLRNMDCTNIIISFKDLFDVSTVLLQSTLETTTPFSDAWRLRDFPPRLAACISSPTSIEVYCCPSRPWTRPLSSRPSIHSRCWFYSATWSD